MAKMYTAPHIKTHVIDNSIYVPLVREDLPLFIPIFFMRASEGPCGVPHWIPSYNDATDLFGDGTFDQSTPYYSREATYLEKIFQRQGSFMVRLADANATRGSLVLRATVTKKPVTMHQLDEDGYYVLDEDTLTRVPEVDGTGNPIQEMGVEIKFHVTPLLEVDGVMETLDSLRAIDTSGEIMYPLIAGEASSVGSYINNTGIKFWCDTYNLDATLSQAVGSLQYNFGVVRKTYGQDTVSPVHTKLFDTYVPFVTKPKSIYQATAMAVDFDSVIEFNYNENAIPAEIRVYHESFAEIGQAIMDVEPDDETLTDPYLVNITSELNIESKPMRHVYIDRVSADAINLDKDQIIYFQEGDDGDISDANIEKLTRQYIEDMIYPEIMDQPRYPFTHIIDTGVTRDTKEAFIEFLGRHDAHKLILSTQDCSLGRYMTKAEDLSLGFALHAKCLLQPESTEKGTGACRAEIYMQSGLRVNDIYNVITPTTYDVIGKKSDIMSTGTITGQLGGRPTSEINIYRQGKWNWAPFDLDHKQLAWENGLNYFQYFDMTGIHWPSMRTVYRYDTSVLSSALYTDVVVYTKHIARYNWSIFAGLELPFDIVAEQARKSIMNDMLTMLGGLYNVDVKIYQTEEDANLGWRSTVDITITGHPQMRVWNVNVICERSGYNSSSGGN